MPSPRPRSSAAPHGGRRPPTVWVSASAAQRRDRDVVDAVLDLLLISGLLLGDPGYAPMGGGVGASVTWTGLLGTGRAGCGCLHRQVASRSVSCLSLGVLTVASVTWQVACRNGGMPEVAALGVWL